MKLGFFAANYAHLSLEEVAKIMSEHGYEMMEIPAYIGNGQFDCDEILKGNNAETLKKMLESYGITISALSNHADSLLILGPWGEDTDGLYKGTKEEKIKYGTESLIKTAQAANALGVPGGKRLYGSDELGEVFSVSVPPGMGNDGEGFREVFHADPGQIQGIWSEVCGRAASEQLHL